MLLLPYISKLFSSTRLSSNTWRSTFSSASWCLTKHLWMFSVVSYFLLIFFIHDSLFVIFWNRINFYHIRSPVPLLSDHTDIFKIHSDLQLVPERMKIDTCQKLSCDMYDKKIYVIHLYRELWTDTRKKCRE